MTTDRPPITTKILKELVQPAMDEPRGAWLAWATIVDPSLTPNDARKLTVETLRTLYGGGPREYEAWIAHRFEGATLWGYRELGLAIGRKPETLRTALMRRNNNIRARGEPLPQDMLAPDCYQPSRQYPEPKWEKTRARDWAMQTGKMRRDGTPIPPRQKAG